MLTIAPGEVYPPAEAFRLQARLISVRAGLQIIRYDTAKNDENPPVVLLQAMPEDCAYVTLLSSKDNAGCSLEAPGDIIVIKALRDVRLVATIASASPGAGAAVLKIERIGGRVPAPGRAESATATVEIIKKTEHSELLSR